MTRSRIALIAIVLVLGAGVLTWQNRGEVRAVVSDTVGLHRVEALAPEISVAAAAEDLDPNLVASIVFHESRGQVDAKSYAGALGLMQLVPAAASDAAGRVGVPVPTEDQLRSDAALNLRLGCNHLAWLLDNRGDMDLEQVMVSYNAGRTKLRRWIKRNGSYEGWVRHEEAALKSGDDTGALTYARGVVQLRDRFEDEGKF